MAAAAILGNAADGDAEEEDDDDAATSASHNVHVGSQLESLQFVYVEKCGEDVRCGKCRLVLEKPVIQSLCGERWHDKCYKLLMQSGNVKCPVCDKELEGKMCWRDVFAEKQLDNLQVYCPGRKNGCNFIGAKKLAMEHVLRCGRVEIPCINGCEMRIIRSELPHHLMSECQYQLQECELCKEKVKRIEMKTHLATTCPKQYVSCVNNCQTGVPLLREELEVHLKECRKREATCPILNCSDEIASDQLDKHFEDNLKTHISHLNDGCISVQQSLQTLSASLEEQLKTLKWQVDEEMQKMDKLNHRLAESEEKMSRVSALVRINQQETLELCYQSVDGAQQLMKQKVDGMEKLIQMVTDKLLKLEEIILTQSTKIEHIEQEVSRKSQSVGISKAAQEQLTAQDRVMATHDIKLAEHSLRLDMMDCKNTDGVLLWKITEIRRRRRDAVSGKTPSIYSQPFYTSQNGYKMCARLYLNGDGMGKGSHLSLFFVVMRGEYDSLLSWPFQHKVTLVLIDQEGQRHISDTFRPDPSSSSFMRPRNEMNIASGCPLFVSLSTLDSGGYIEDDCLFIKIIVDIANVSRPEAR